MNLYLKKEEKLAKSKILGRFPKRSFFYTNILKPLTIFGNCPTVPQCRISIKPHCERFSKLTNSNFSSRPFSKRFIRLEKFYNNNYLYFLDYSYLYKCTGPQVARANLGGPVEQSL